MFKLIQGGLSDNQKSGTAQQSGKSPVTSGQSRSDSNHVQPSAQQISEATTTSIKSSGNASPADKLKSVREAKKLVEEIADFIERDSDLTEVYGGLDPAIAREYLLD